MRGWVLLRGRRYELFDEDDFFGGGGGASGRLSNGGLSPAGGGGQQGGGFVTAADVARTAVRCACVCIAYGACWVGGCGPPSRQRKLSSSSSSSSSSSNGSGQVAKGSSQQEGRGKERVKRACRPARMAGSRRSGRRNHGKRVEHTCRPVHMGLRGCVAGVAQEERASAASPDTKGAFEQLLCGLLHNLVLWQSRNKSGVQVRGPGHPDALPASRSGRHLDAASTGITAKAREETRGWFTGRLLLPPAGLVHGRVHAHLCRHAQRLPGVLLLRPGAAEVRAPTLPPPSRRAQLARVYCGECSSPSLGPGGGLGLSPARLLLVKG